MKKLMITCLLGIYFLGSGVTTAQTGENFGVEKPKPAYVMVIHGGAGFGSPETLPENEQNEYCDKMTEALHAGETILKEGGSSINAVEAAINIMEDSPLFNSGKGAVFNSEGKNELDASIMDGKTHNAGAVANVHTIKNPISAARKVMTDSKHVMLIREGAERFADEMELKVVDSSYFFTQKSWNSYLRRKKEEDENKNDKHGTVGAVAMDMKGNLAAGTSTGGMTYKKYGRVGDSPIIGAGTYADNQTCAVSATGHGEFFIRNVVAYDVAARMKYLGEDLQTAANYIINHKLKMQDANGGIICVDNEGNIAWPFNTTLMLRGTIREGEEAEIRFFKEK